MLDVRVIPTKPYFVTVVPPAPPKPYDPQTFPQRVMRNGMERRIMHHQSGAADSGGILGYMLTKMDKE